MTPDVVEQRELYLNPDADLGWLIAMPFGGVSDEVLGGEIRVGDRF